MPFYLNIKNTTSLLLLIAPILFLSACGGGGGSPATPATPSVVYDGLLTAATIDNTNARNIAVSFYGAADPGQTYSAIGAVITPITDETTVNNFSNLIHTLAQSINPTTPQDNIAVGVTVNGILLGQCNGAVHSEESTFSTNYNETTQNFTGTVNFNNFRSCAGGLSGPATISGHMNNFNEIDDLTISFASLRFTGPGKNWELSGSFSYNSPSYGNYTIAMNFDVLTNNSDIYRLENYNIVYDGNGPSANVIISGRFYHSEYGYVDISTLTGTPMTLTYVSEYPTQGVVKLTGANGTTGPMSMLIIYNFDGTHSFDIELDTDGDGAANETLSCGWLSACAAL